MRFERRTGIQVELGEILVTPRTCHVCGELDAATCDRCVSGMLRSWSKRAEHVEALAKRLVFCEGGPGAYRKAFDDLQEYFGPQNGKQTHE